MAAKKANNAAAELRQTVLASGRQQRELEQAAGIGQGILSRFVHGTRGLTLTTADKLAEVLGLRWRLVKARKRR